MGSWTVVYRAGDVTTGLLWSHRVGASGGGVVGEPAAEGSGAQTREGAIGPPDPIRIGWRLLLLSVRAGAALEVVGQRQDRVADLPQPLQPRCGACDLPPLRSCRVLRVPPPQLIRDHPHPIVQRRDARDCALHRVSGERVGLLPNLLQQRALLLRHLP